MGNFFQVDLDVLQQMTKTLQDAGDQMESALSAMNSTQAAQIGTAALDKAAGDFQHTWQYGLKQLRQAIAETNEGVRKAHDAYKQVDDGIDQALTKINGTEMGQIDGLVAAAAVHGAVGR